MKTQRGVTLLELLVAVAIVAIVSSISFQLYTGYIDTAGSAVLQQNIESIRVFQEDVRLRTGSYAAGTYDAEGGDTSLTDSIGWEPDDADANFVYVVVTVASGAGYQVSATGPDGQSESRCFGDGCP
jgi:prepilin-type N-terminal cleavage/methylation domain-containing protein